MAKQASDCGRLMKEISDCMEKEANNALRQHDLTLTQVSALVVMQEYGEKKIPLKKLEQLLHVSQPTVNGIVSRLAQKGMLGLSEDAEDKRVKYVYLTELGREKCQSTRIQKEIMEQRMMEALPEAEQRQFQEMLGKIWRHLFSE